MDKYGKRCDGGIKLGELRDVNLNHFVAETLVLGGTPRARGIHKDLFPAYLQDRNLSFIIKNGDSDYSNLSVSLTKEPVQVVLPRVLLKWG